MRTEREKLISRTRGLAAEMRSHGGQARVDGVIACVVSYRAQVKVRPSGVYLSAQGHGNHAHAGAMVQEAFPRARRTSGSFGASDWSMTWRIDA